MTLTRTLRRRPWVVPVLISPIMIGVVLTASPAEADSAFDALANAYAVQVTATNQSLPVGLVIEGDGPVSSAHLNSSGQSDALAAFPYPGDTVAGLPGLAGALFGVPFPGYPFVAASQYGADPADINYPGVSLHAESGAHHAAAESVFGSDPSGSSSDARVEQLADESVQSIARTAADGLVLGDKVRISGFTSFAKVFADGSTGELTRSTQLSFGRIFVPGLAIQVPANSPTSVPLLNPVPGLPQPPPAAFPPIPLPLGGTTIQAPDIGFVDGQFNVALPGLGAQRFAIPAQPVLDAFKAAGVTLTYQTPVSLETGVVGGALDIKFELPAGPDNPYFQGTTPVTYTVGRSTSLVTLRPLSGPAFTSGAAGVLGGTGAGAESGLGIDGIAGSTDGLGLPPAGGELPASLDGSSVPTAILTPGQGDGADLVAANQTYGDVGNIYLALLCGGLVAAFAAWTLRMLGVRFLWSS